MPPVVKRLRISLVGSTSSIGDRVAGRAELAAARAASPARRSRRRRARGTPRSARGRPSPSPFGPYGELERGDRRRVPGVALAVAPPGVDAALGQQVGVRGRQQRVLDVLGEAAVVLLGIGAGVALERLAGELAEPDAADRRRRAGEAAVDDVAVEADRLEDLGAAVGLDRRDPHLRDHLQQALADRREQLLERLVVGEVAGQLGAAVQVGERVEQQVRVDGGGAEADQRGEVVDLARLAGLDDEARSGGGGRRGRGRGGRRRAPSSEGIATRSAARARSERTIRFAPPSSAECASAQIRSSASGRPASPADERPGRCRSSSA